MSMWTGRCHCSAVRYQLKARPEQLSLCHCEDCRRSGGGPYQGWMFVKRGGFTLLSGELKTFAYDGRERSFCSNCGSPITFADLTLPEWVEVALGSCDQAADLRPADYNWMGDHLPWVPLDAALPQFAQNSPAPCST